MQPLIPWQNFISMSTIRDITALRQEFLSTLISLNLVPRGSTPSSPSFNTHSSHAGLVKAVILAGLWPRVARVVLPKGAIKFDRVQAGTVQRANEAREYKFFDIHVDDKGGRVFLHPSSVLFRSAEWKSPFVAYFQKQQTTKLWLRDATEVSLAPNALACLAHLVAMKGADICDASFRRACHCEPCRRGTDNRQQECFHQIEGMAPHWGAGEPVEASRSSCAAIERH